MSVAAFIGLSPPVLQALAKSLRDGALSREGSYRPIEQIAGAEASAIIGPLHERMVAMPDLNVRLCFDVRRKEQQLGQVAFLALPALGIIGYRGHCRVHVGRLADVEPLVGTGEAPGLADLPGHAAARERGTNGVASEGGSFIDIRHSAIKAADCPVWHVRPWPRIRSDPEGCEIQPWRRCARR